MDSRGLLGSLTKSFCIQLLLHWLRSFLEQGSKLILRFNKGKHEHEE